MKELSANTQKTYGTYAKIFNAWLNGRKPTLKLGEAFLEDMRQKGAKQNTVGVAGRALRRIFNLKVGVPNIEMLEPEYLAVEEIKTLIEKAPTLLEKTLLIMLFSTGCRISEILNLMMKDVELEKQVITVVRKGGRRQRTPLGDEGTEALKVWLKARQSNTARVFMDYSYQNIYYRFKMVAKKAKVKHFHPHMLRHSRGRQLSQAGVSMERISEILDHRRLDTTAKIYGNLKAEERAKYLAPF
jgi:site-specific recombinase XerD